MTLVGRIHLDQFTWGGSSVSQERYCLRLLSRSATAQGHCSADNNQPTVISHPDHPHVTTAPLPLGSGALVSIAALRLPLNCVTAHC